MKQDAPASERKIRRILHLQRQLHRLSQWRLSELQGQEAAIQDKQRDLIGALNGDGRLQGLFVAAMAKRLTSLAGEVPLSSLVTLRPASAVRSQLAPRQTASPGEGRNIHRA